MEATEVGVSGLASGTSLGHAGGDVLLHHLLDVVPERYQADGLSDDRNRQFARR